MALPINDLKLSQVIAEIAGTQVSLQDCVDDATGTFNPSYYSAPADRLRDFRGYEDISGNSFQMSTLGSTTSINACGTTLFTTRYHDGGTTYPQPPNDIFEDPSMSTLFDGGNLYYKIPGDGSVIKVDTYGSTLTSTICPSVPSAPYNLLTTNIVNTSFLLKWTAPSNGGDPIDGYKIYDDGVYKVTSYGTGTQKSITGLTAGTTSTWTVRAYNGVGDGALSSGKSVTQTSGSIVFSIYMTTNGQTFSNDACNAFGMTTRWTTTTPVQNGSTIYTTSAGTTVFNGANKYFMDDEETKNRYRISSTGVVSSQFECPGECFIAGTQISLVDGSSVSIETLKVGDELLSVEVENLTLTNRVSTFKEVKRIGSKIKQFKEATVEHTIIINNGLLEATAMHNHLIERNGEWMYQQFQEIEIGDKMYDSEKNIIEVTNIDYNIEDRVIYKITLEDTHTYFANGILTHNLK